MEQERLALQHRALQMVFEGRLIFPPVAHPIKVLDCGCGSAAWATEVAETFPDSEVRHCTLAVVQLDTYG